MELFSAVLAPNTFDNDGNALQTYIVSYFLEDGSTYSQVWVVPVSSSPVTISAVKKNSILPRYSAVTPTSKGDSVLDCSSRAQRFGMGVDGYIPYADSTQPCGIRWGPAASTGGSLIGGAAGSLPYQSAASTTAMLPGNTAATDAVPVSHGTGSAARAPVLSNTPALGVANMVYNQGDSNAVNITQSAKNKQTISVDDFGLSRTALRTPQPRFRTHLPGRTIILGQS
jgi:hypothetical protein